MAAWGADILVLNFGPDFRYLTGMEAPLYYTILKGHGDWITSVIVSHDHAPVIVLHPWFNVDVQTWVEDVRVMPPHDAAPGAFLAGVLGEFALRRDDRYRQDALGADAALCNTRHQPRVSSPPTTR